MIFATVQPLEKYDIMCEGRQAGIYSTYFGRSPVLFNLVTRASTVPFQYEPGNDGLHHFFTLDKDFLYEETLGQIVGGRTVERLCSELSPVQMFDFFKANLSDLPALGVTRYWYGDVDLVLDVVLARALQWKKYQRGSLSQDGNVIQVRFGSLLEKGEEVFLLKMNPYHKDFKDPKEVGG